MDNNLVVFSDKYMVTMQKIADLERTIKELDDTRKKVRAELQEAMEFYGLRSVDNDILTLTLVAPSVSTTIDTTALRMKTLTPMRDSLMSIRRRQNADSH